MMFMKRKIDKSVKIESVLDKIDALLTHAHVDILTDLEKKESLRQYTHEDLHRVVNDVYKLAITRDVLTKSR
jgi:hypothetical protein